jgi:hypothetical protein
MAYYSAQAVMTGSAIQVSTLLPVAATYVRQLLIQGATANVAQTVVGGSNLTTTTNIGAATGPVASVPTPIQLGPIANCALDLTKIYVAGANTEVVYLSAVV